MSIINTTDLCDEHIDELSVAKPIGFKDYGAKKSFHGEIVTIKALENNPLVRSTLGQNGKGKVLVVDGAGSDYCALMGDNVAALGLEHEWEGVVIFGAIRDSKSISALNIGVKALFTSPRKSGKKEVGDLNVTVNFAGINFKPGAFIYCDEDGIVVSDKNYDL